MARQGQPAPVIKFSKPPSVTICTQQTSSQKYQFLKTVHQNCSATSKECSNCTPVIRGEKKQDRSNCTVKQVLDNSVQTETFLQIDDPNLQVLENYKNIGRYSPKPGTSKCRVIVGGHNTNGFEPFSGEREQDRDKCPNKKDGIRHGSKTPEIQKIDDSNLQDDSPDRPRDYKIISKCRAPFHSLYTDDLSVVPDERKQDIDNCTERQTPTINSFKTATVQKTEGSYLQDGSPNIPHNYKVIGRYSPKPGTSKCQAVFHNPYTGYFPAILDVRQLECCNCSERQDPTRNSFKTQTVLHIDPDQEDYYPNIRQECKTKGEYSSRPGPSKCGLLVASYSKESEVCEVRSSATVRLDPLGNCDPIETRRDTQDEMTVLRTSFETTIEANTSSSMSVEDGYSSSKVEYSKIQWLFIIMSWITTAIGLGVYMYFLVIAFTKNPKILTESSSYYIIIMISNICLLCAAYFHCKIRKYLLQ